MNAASAAPGGKPNLSKMGVMVGCLVMANKITYTDELVAILRVAYYVVQLGTLILAYIIIRSKILDKKDLTKIYLPAVQTPWAPAEAQGRQKETTYHDHEMEQVNMLVKSTCIGLLTVSFIHWKMGVKPVLLMQSILGPMNLLDNGLIKKYLLGSKEKVWNETLERDSNASAPAASQPARRTLTEDKGDRQTTLEDVMDKVLNKELSPSSLLSLLTSENINYQTQNERYSPLMVLSSRPDAEVHHIRIALQKGADVFLKDDDGCTALHWAAMKGCKAAAEVLSEGAQGQELSQVKDGDEKTALELATQSIEENHEEVEAILSKVDIKADVD